MSYSSTPPFDIIGVSPNIDYLQTLVVGGNIYLLYIDNDAANDPLHIAIIDVVGQQLTNDTILLDLTDCPIGTFAFNATLGETASGKIGVLVYTTAGTSDMGYMSVNADCTTAQTLNFYGVTGANYPRITKADFLSYEVIVSWIDSLGLNGAFIDNVGNFDFNSLAVSNSDPIFLTTGVIARCLVVQGLGTTVLALFSYQDNGTAGKIYAAILDGPFSSIITWQLLETDVDYQLILQPVDLNTIFCTFQSDPNDINSLFDLLTVEATSLLAFTVTDLGTMNGQYGIQTQELRTTVIPSTLDFASATGPVLEYRNPGYLLVQWQAGILGDEDSASAAFYYGTTFGMVGRRSFDDQNQAQIFTSSAPVVSLPPFLIPEWKYGITALVCTPCAPTIYDREGNPIF